MIDVKTFDISEKYSESISFNPSSQSGGFALCTLSVANQGPFLWILFAVSGKQTSAFKEAENPTCECIELL